MELVKISQSKGIPFVVDEYCLINENGDYIGQKTGKIYSRENYKDSEQYKAKIISVDNENKTGMYHLFAEWNNEEDENRKTFKEKYLNCYVTVQKHFYCDGKQVYRCLELDEYFSEDEIEIIE